MKTLDAEAIGKLVAGLIEQETTYPLADREDGYEHDTVNYVEYVAGDYSRVRLVTNSGLHFTIEVKRTV